MEELVTLRHLDRFSNILWQIERTPKHLNQFTVEWQEQLAAVVRCQELFKGRIQTLLSWEVCMVYIRTLNSFISQEL